jgi:carbohydrate kinase (thermoresistant glucokinase family)
VSPAAAILIMMGVSGSGKTTIGRQVANRLDWPFKEGDDLHPPANIAKMRVATPLTDVDRAPWLAAVARWIDGWRRAGVSGVITCSALKRAYRRGLAHGRPEVRFVYLTGDASLLEKRVFDRHGHFMPASLLASQLADLEAPASDEGAIVVSVDQSVEAQVQHIVQALETTASVRGRE